MQPGRIDSLLGFLALADRLKTVERRGLVPLPDGSLRRENSAEHCWSLALVALLLHREVAAELDLGHALSMIAVHDLVEVEAGDTYAYDPAGRATQAERETAAAAVVFGALPADLGTRLRALWEEFEAGETPTARFANALDRLQPLLANMANQGGSWRSARVTLGQVQRRMAPIEQGCPALWPWVCRTLAQAHADGLIPLEAPGS